MSTEVPPNAGFPPNADVPAGDENPARGGAPSPTRRGRSRRRRGRAFAVGFATVVGVLAVVALGGAALTSALGPRVTDVQVDAGAAATASGSRIIITTTQSLTEVAAEQVTVTPATDFSVDTSGRSIGVRFTLPLWDETEYTVRIEGVRGIGGGPDATIEESFTTPALEVFLLQRGDEGDTIFRTDLTGEAAVPVFTHERIEDFRATAGHLVVATVDDTERSQLIVTDLDGEGAQALALPGEGSVTNLQSADRGNTIGFLFTDAGISAEGGRESMLYTASPAAPAAEPVAVERIGGESRVEDWRFVPGTDGILMFTFDGALTLVAPGGEPVALGNAIAIHGVARGNAVAVIERAEGPVAIDLATAEEVALPATDPALGQAWDVTPLPGAGGASLRAVTEFDGFDVVATSVLLVDGSGGARAVFAVGAGDALLQTCVSPSGRYAAFLVAPSIVENPYDGYQLPLPQRVETHLVALEDGAELVALSGFDISWCQHGPRP